jgi:hypothetical protein
MWDLINCYLAGRHQYTVWCEPGVIYLRCTRCGRRSAGWEVKEQHMHPRVGNPLQPASASPRHPGLAAKALR